MDLERFRHFKLLAERGHLRETAELVSLSPGALSRAMKALERDLGVQLFRVSGKRLVLSDRGRALLPRVDRLLAEYSAVREGAAERASGQTPIRFCSYSIFTTYFLGHFLRETSPTEEVYSRNLGPGAMEASVAAFESDFGLTYLPVPTPGIEFVPVQKIAMGVFVRQGAFTGKPLDEIPCSMPILRISAAPAHSRIDAWPEELPRGRVQFHIEQLETALECCRQGLSWGYFPQFLVWLHNEQVRPELALVPRKVASQQSLATFLVKRVGDDESPAMKLAARVLQAISKKAKAEL